MGNWWSSLPSYTMTEVANHNTAEDCWIIANQYVYNVTSFIPFHPGNEQAIINKAGTNCTVDFNFHSKKGRKLWNRYLIGKLSKGT